MKVIEQSNSQNLELYVIGEFIRIDQDYNDGSENYIIVEKENTRELALSICPELEHLEGALLAEQELNNQLKEGIERLKALNIKANYLLAKASADNIEESLYHEIIEQLKSK